MNWEAIGAIGEIIGAAAVVVSLIYLAIQIRNQNIETRAAAMHDISAGFRASAELWTDRELAEIVIKAEEDYDGLSKAEKLRFVAGMHGLFRVYEEAFNLHKSGRLDENIWDGMNRQYSSYLAGVPFAKYWEIRRDHYNAEFQSYVASVSKSSWELG